MSGLEKRKAETRRALEAMGLCPEAFSRLGLRAVFLVEGIDEAYQHLQEEEFLMVRQEGRSYLMAEMDRRNDDGDEEEGGGT